MNPADLATYNRDYELSEQLRPIFKHVTQIVALPHAKNAWLAWDTGEVSGEVSVVAFAQRMEEVSCHGFIEVGNVERHGRYYREYRVADAEYQNPLQANLEFRNPMYLVLADDAGSWESQWTEAEHVFFSRAAAESAAAEMKAEHDKREARKAAG